MNNWMDYLADEPEGAERLCIHTCTRCGTRDHIEYRSTRDECLHDPATWLCYECELDSRTCAPDCPNRIDIDALCAPHCPNHEED